MINNKKHHVQVAIVGGGPVGLFLGCCLQQAGISFVVLEKRAEPITHSRSIGIHPVSLELFNKIGLANAFVSKGIKVEQGLAFCNEEHIGTLSFHTCPPPYRFILTLPQFKTEQILADRLQEENPSVLRRNVVVSGIEQQPHGIELQVNQNENFKTIRADYAVGCDGKDSFIRKAAGIDFTGKDYDDTYIMGDFTDNTRFGSAAAIFICNEGLIESFPLSQEKRRWVVKTDRYLPTVNRNDIETRIDRRISQDLQFTENTMRSSFGVQKRFADRMFKNRILLAGDSAHIVSPIGGQGMNLGWLDGWDLCQTLQKIFGGGKTAPAVFNAYSNRRLKAAGKAARRAEFNMAIGRKSNLLIFKKLLLKGMIKTPLSRLAARSFTMRGLNTALI